MSKNRFIPGMVALIVATGVVILPQQSANAWFFNNKCKKPIASANKAVKDTALLSRIILNNKSCFDPIVVANAQICVKLDFSRQSTLGFFNSSIACDELPRSYK